MKLNSLYKIESLLILFCKVKIVICYLISFFGLYLLKPKNLKRLCLSIIFNLSFLISSAQTYPVQISTQLIPPYSGYLPDYADPTAQNLKVILQFNDFTVPSYNLKLKFEIKGNGFSLVTKSIYNPPPLSLQPGQPLLLSGIDIAPYLSSNNLDFIGINQSQYEQRMALPEGYYSICVKAYDYYSGSPVQVSNEACAQGWFTLSNPPLLNLPLCNTVVTPLQPQNLLFSWTPVNLGSPNSAFNTSYLFELWEMRPDSTVNPNQLVQNTQPIFSQATTFNSLNYGIADPPLNLYNKYAWRVRVIDGSGRDWFINNGFSQVCTFYYGSISNTLGNNTGLNIQAEALDYTTGKATWTLQTIYNAYQFEVRKANTQNWFPYTTTSGSQQIDNLEPNNTYECRVKGFGNDFNSEYSNTVQFTTPNAPTYNCNQTAPIYSLNTTPLPINKALPGITLRSGQFDIKIKTIEPAPNGLGWYKGSGYALMFGLLPVPVTFTNVFIDDKLRHQQGLIEAVTQGIKNWMVQFDIEDAEDNATYTEGTLDSVYINGNQYCYTTIQNQTPVCTTLDTTNKITVIRDGDGNQYVVNAGPPPTVTGPTNYLNTSNDNLAASDTLKVEFIASPNQNFGFDGKEYAAFVEGYECIKLSNGKNYFVPNKSIGINQNDKVYASCIINNLVAANLSFKTFGGAILSKTSVNPTVFEITNIPANANCIYAWYNNKKIGKLNVTNLNKVNKKVVLVSVNSASLSLGGSQMGAALNAIYKQANTNFTITTATNFTFNLGNDGLEAADANLMSKYSAEMRALRNAYKQKDSLYDRNAYYFFIVSNFNDGNIKGYMARGRALGFLSANATATDVAHELAHGAFKLEHTFPAIPKATSNNLMDYNNGTHLVKSQWLNIQNPTNELTWLDSEEDGSLFDYDLGKFVSEKFGLSCYNTYKNYDGIIPQCFWNNSTCLNPSVDCYKTAMFCGLFDGLFLIIKDTYSLLELINCWTGSNPIYYTQACEQKREKTINTIKAVKEICGKTNGASIVYNQMSQSLGNWSYETFCTNLTCSYNQGRLVFDILSFVYGGGELKTVFTGGITATKLATYLTTIDKTFINLPRVLAKGGHEMKKIGATFYLYVKLNTDPKFTLGTIDAAKKAIHFNVPIVKTSNAPRIAEKLENIAYVVTENGQQVVKRGDVEIVSESGVAKAVVTEAGGSLFGKSVIAGISGFSDNVATLASQQGLNLTTFKNIEELSVQDLIQSQSQNLIKLNSIRNNIPLPNATTLMQKVIPKSDIQKYLSGQYKSCKGFMSTAKDSKHLNNYNDIYYGMRLDYQGSAFSISDGSCGVIRFKAPNANTSIVPRSSNNVLAGVDDAPFPYTGHGFTSGTNGRLGVPEWKMNTFADLQNGEAELYEVFSNGTEVLKARFNKQLGQFVPVQ